MTKLRKENAVLIYGKYTLLDQKNPAAYAYARELDGKKMLVLLNFTKEKATVNTRINIKNAKVLINNYSTFSGTLLPYQAVVLEVGK
jgi:oligo-1,6-glucosidase